MKKGIIVNLRRFKLWDYVNQNRLFIILCVFFVLGISLSVYFTKNNLFVSKFSNYLFDKAISLHNSGSFIKKFLISFFRYFIILLLYFLSGVSLFGFVLTPFITIWQGIVLGSIIANIYSLYGLTGIAFNAIILIPPCSIFVVSCFFISKYAMNFSLSIAKLTLPKCRPITLYNSFRGYCVKFLIVVSIVVFISLIEIILNTLFLKMFNF